MKHGAGTPQLDFQPRRGPVPQLALSQLQDSDRVIDVRSPAEYAEDHLPSAANVPLLDDQERARVGTLFRLEGVEACLLYTSPSPRDQRGSRMPSSA